MKTAIAIVFGVSALILFFVLFTRGEQESEKTERTNREVALTCTTDMATEFHIHPTLEIIVNGERQEIPPNIGVLPNCMNALHTHDAIGTIHVESPERRDFTLADFFAVWGKPFTSEEILGFKTDEKHRIKVLVDGVEVGTYENTVLKDKEKIIISYEAI
jgi:hypothetical protein